MAGSGGEAHGEGGVARGEVGGLGRLLMRVRDAVLGWGQGGLLRQALEGWEGWQVGVGAGEGERSLVVKSRRGRKR